jgi:hypothetical protein
MTLTNRTARHRRTREIPAGRIAGTIAALAVLLALTGATGALTALLAPGQSAAMLRPAVTATAGLRPVWDGRNPEVWTADQEPMCSRHLAGLKGWAMDPRTGARFRMECQAEGDNGPWSWSVI